MSLTERINQLYLEQSKAYPYLNRVLGYLDYIIIHKYTGVERIIGLCRHHHTVVNEPITENLDYPKEVEINGVKLILCSDLDTPLQNTMLELELVKPELELQLSKKYPGCKIKFNKLTETLGGVSFYVEIVNEGMSNLIAVGAASVDSKYQVVKIERIYTNGDSKLDSICLDSYYDTIIKLKKELYTYDCNDILLEITSHAGEFPTNCVVYFSCMLFSSGGISKRKEGIAEVYRGQISNVMLISRECNLLI
jgi:hypothetical protein